jgi:hypothetical protein
MKVGFDEKKLEIVIRRAKKSDYISCGLSRETDCVGKTSPGLVKKINVQFKVLEKLTIIPKG